MSFVHIRVNSANLIKSHVNQQIFKFAVYIFAVRTPDQIFITHYDIHSNAVQYVIHNKKNHLCFIGFPFTQKLPAFITEVFNLVEKKLEIYAHIRSIAFKSLVKLMEMFGRPE